jgi:hypothetical protein
MARIKITDLPLLQDLTEEQLKELFGAGAKSYRPTFESLEDRRLMSGFTSLLATTPVQQFAPVASNGNPIIQAIAPVAPQSSPLAGVVLDSNYQPTAQQTGAAAALAAGFGQPTDPLAGLTLDTNYQQQTSQAQKDLIDAFSQPTDPLAGLTLDTNYQRQESSAVIAAFASIQSANYVSDVPSDPSALQVRTYPSSSSDQEQGRKAIETEVAQLGAARLGAAIDQASFPTKDGYGRIQNFTNGTIYWSPLSPSRAYVVEGLMREEYVQQNTPGHSLGYPTSEPLFPPRSPGVVVQYFDVRDGGSPSGIVWTQPTGAHAISGKIFRKWADLGGTDYGVPIAPQFSTGGVLTQDFRWDGAGSRFSATIVSSPNTGTHDVVGAIRDRWINLGTGAFGLPTTDSTIDLSSGNRLNAIVHFRFYDGDGPHDKALGTTALGTFAVWGEIYTAWYSRDFGKEIGIPISDEHDFSLGGRAFRVSTFLSNGLTKSIYWSADRDGYGLNWVAGLAQIGADSHFYLDNGDGQGPEVMDFTPRGGPTGFEKTAISEPLIPISKTTGTTSAPLTVSPTYESMPGGVFGPNSDVLALLSGLQSRAYTPVATDAVLMSPNLWNVTPVTDYTAFTGLNALPADFDFTAINGMPIDRPAPVDDSTGDGVTSSDADGSQTTPVADFTNTSFALTDDNGTAHQLQIQAQSPQADGSATFTGACDGQSGNGSIFYDAAGNLHLWFVGDDSSTVDSIISGDAGAYQLDGRLASPDGTTIHAVGSQTAPQVAGVADFTNAAFNLTDDTGTAHQLQIQAQSPQPDGSATFTGVCDGHFGSGTIFYDAAGNIHMTFTAEDASTVDGIVSGDPGAYQFDGSLTSADGTTIHAAGGQTAAQVATVADFTNAGFDLTDGSGTAHQLQITDQTAQPDGTATFNGVWDGQSVAGTLAYDAAGNIRIQFSGDNGSCDATIAGEPGAFQIDGNVTMLGGDTPLAVTGNQLV